MQRVLGSLLTGVKANFILEVLHGSGVVDDDLQCIAVRIRHCSTLNFFTPFVHFNCIGVKIASDAEVHLTGHGLCRGLPIQADELEAGLRPTTSRDSAH